VQGSSGLPRLPNQEFSGIYESKRQTDLPHSIVRCDSTKAFELQPLVIRYQGGHKVRLANYAGSSIKVAVKKLYDRAAAERETQFHRRCADCEHIVPLLDYAVVAHLNQDTGESISEYNLFKEYSNRGDLRQFKAMLRKQLTSNTQGSQYHQQLINITLRQMIMAVAELHSKGLYHGGINLTNYFVSGNLMSADALKKTLKVKLSNFAMTNDTQFTAQAEIPRPQHKADAIYFPPEVYLQADLLGGLSLPEVHASIDRVKQDSFSLGLSLLEFISSKEFVKYFAAKLGDDQDALPKQLDESVQVAGGTIKDIIRMLTGSCQIICREFCISTLYF
jgi:serine/threonine protein kinase